MGALKWLRAHGWQIARTAVLVFAFGLIWGRMDHLEARLGNQTVTASYSITIDHNHPDQNGTVYRCRVSAANANDKLSATMTRIEPGWTVAVSPDLPHLQGKLLWIEGLGVRRAECFTAPHITNTVDVYFPKGAKLDRFNTGERTVIVLPEGHHVEGRKVS